MDAMRDALKSKRSGGMLMAEAGPEASGGGMSDLVQSLSDDQKRDLMQALVASSGSEGGTSPSDIEKGQPSDEERSKIEAKMGDEGPGVPEEESDDIAMSMLDSKSKMPGAENAQPRNLGERVKLGLAAKLKGKGKL